MTSSKNTERYRHINHATLTLTIADNNFADFSEQQNTIRRRYIELQSLRPLTTIKHTILVPALNITPVLVVQIIKDIFIKHYKAVEMLAVNSIHERR